MSDIRDQMARDREAYVIDEGIVPGLRAKIESLTAEVARLTREVEHWREIATEDPEKWSFDALVWMANRMLTEIYPEKVFTGESGELGPGFVSGFRKLIASLTPKEQPNVPK
jgi:hypothetical protein